MTALTAGTLLVLFLPFLLSLAGQAGTPMVLCFVTSMLAMLLSVGEFGAVLLWCQVTPESPGTPRAMVYSL
jgi:hypothetical protein